MKDINTIIGAVWDDIIQWHRKNAPLHLHLLRTPAAPDLLASLEQDLGPGFPEDLRASLALYDGGFNIDGFETLSAGRILSRWRDMENNRIAGKYDSIDMNSEAEGKLRRGWWRPGWIPFAQESGGDLLCADMDPGAKGTKGQVILLSGEGPACTHDSAYLAWLQQFRDDLFADRMFVDAEGFVARKYVQ